MGNTLGRHSEENKRNVMDFVNILCRDNDLSVVENEAKYCPDTRKWVVVVRNNENSEWSRYELFHERLLDMDRVRQKLLLKGDHFHRFESYYVNETVHCFEYKHQKSISTVLNEGNFLLARQREVFLHDIIQTVLLAMKELNSKGLCHQRLSWDTIELHPDGKAKLGALEYTVPMNRVPHHQLALVRHLPPEVLKCLVPRQRSVEKVQMWILGSLLLEILTQKCISGPVFQQPTHDITHLHAWKNIKSNRPYLPAVLLGTTLTSDTQKVLLKMLHYNPAERWSLEEALGHYCPQPERPSVKASSILSLKSAAPSSIKICEVKVSSCSSTWV